MHKGLVAAVVAFAVVTGLAAPGGAEEVHTARPAPECGAPLAPAERRALPWDAYEFGQADGLPMNLAGRGCYGQAAAASRDYLAFGPLLTTRQQAITTLHMGRNLAFAGHEAEAAIAVAASRRSEQASGGLDWNGYVQGVYAFLVKDAAPLDAAVTALGASALEGDRINAANLRRLKACFDRSYVVAMTDAACLAKGKGAAH